MFVRDYKLSSMRKKIYINLKTEFSTGRGL